MTDEKTDIKDGVKNLMDRCPTSCEVEGNALFSWSMKGFGFGQLYFYIGEDGKTHCHNECMGKDTIKKILGTLVDTCVMDDN